jgi:hypothetical protein
MIPDPATLQKTVTEYFDNLPHPAAPEIKVKDYPAYARVAMMLKGEFADPGDVKAAHAHLQGAGLSPAEFEYLWGIARPIANRFLGRDPHMVEMQRLQHAHPAEIHDHYASLPHPKISGGQGGRLCPVLACRLSVGHAAFEAGTERYGGGSVCHRRV